MSVKKYTRWDLDGSNETQVHVINQDIEDASWLVVYRFGNTERQEYFNNEEEAYKIASWVPAQGYELLKLTPIELI